MHWQKGREAREQAETNSKNKGRQAGRKTYEYMHTNDERNYQTHTCRQIEKARKKIMNYM